MRPAFGLVLATSFLLAGGAFGADLRLPSRLPPPPPRPPVADGYGSPLRYGQLYDVYSPYVENGPRPRRRVMGGPDYVGSTFGLGRPAYSGIGPRPDWGRSTYD